MFDREALKCQDDTSNSGIITAQSKVVISNALGEVEKDQRQHCRHTISKGNMDVCAGKGVGLLQAV